jgi:hypothetical protein
MLEFVGRDAESGPSPVLARLREGTNRDDNPLYADDIHGHRA